jgi:KUP system potassium uptake protein
VTSQAIKLGYLPRLRIRYTSKDAVGQVYVPSINTMLFVAVVLLTLGFQSTAALATAYGLSVTGTMLIDTLLLAVVAYTSWPDARRWVLPLCALFFVVDLAFLIANGAKLLSGIGAWVPLMIAIVAFTLMRTWRRGRELLHGEIQKAGMRSQTFVPELQLAPPLRVPGTAIFLTPDKGVVPQALLQNLKHNRVLHERNVFLTVQSVPVPYARTGPRLKVETIGEKFYAITISYGFMETPDVPQALMASADQGGLVFDPAETTYYTSRQTVLGSAHRGMPLWRDKLFEVMHRNAAPASDYFRIPTDRLIELGSQVQI